MRTRRCSRDRREAWRACLLPGDDVEQRLVDDAVIYTWQQDRARRAQAERINANIPNYGVDQDQGVKRWRLTELGQRLFTDRLGPLVLYPTVTYADRDGFHDLSFRAHRSRPRERYPDRPADTGPVPAIDAPGLRVDARRMGQAQGDPRPGPALDLVRQTQGRPTPGQAAVDAIDDRDVALVFLASYALIKPEKSAWYWEIVKESDRDGRKEFRGMPPTASSIVKAESAAQARQVLLGIIERATERLTQGRSPSRASPSNGGTGPRLPGIR